MKVTTKAHGRGAERRLIVVSNRLPLSFKRENGELQAVPSSGGLIGALEPIVKEHGGIWVGSAGTEDSPELHRQLKIAAREQHFRYAPIILSREEEANYYEGFSNEVLWPLFHDLQSRGVFDPVYWDFYRRVNRKFADAVEDIASARDLVWVHDYQLMQVGRGIRERRRDAFLSFFLHIPFPSPDIFGKLPWRREVLEGLLDYDFIGLQTARDQRNLVASIRTYLPETRISGRGDQRVVETSRGVTSIRDIPISIDFRDFASSAAAPEVTERVRDIRGQAPEMEIALGIDRLDYTKGIPERLRGLRAFFRSYPQFRRKLTLIQVVVPSRENIPGYRDLRSEIEGVVSSINGEFSEPGWTPVQYIHRSVPRCELLALYRAAGIALITPLKDGMNLVAKEYCAAHIENGGVLILSEFAGAMPELHTGAIEVHPYDEIGISKALKQALEMPAEERHRRMLRMRRTIRENDILRWRDRIFEQMEQARPRVTLAA
ncbi:MAG TPA: trehalose-6-phosphate synthase [Acidobacteriaceae bacterium]|jgi:trehalose 6-phosphate synthase|nr:trehalose-6-phosphate synthase [Acidobacteriaceae bacterium]